MALLDKSALRSIAITTVGGVLAALIADTLRRIQARRGR